MLRELADKVDPRTAALVIIDLQNDYCHDDGALGKTGRDVAQIRQVVPILARFVDEARSVGMTVIHVRMANNSRTKSAPILEQRIRRFGRDTLICEENSWGAEFFTIEPRPGEPIVTKHRYSAFVETDLETILKAGGIKTVLLSGVTSDVCVESTARDAFHRDYYVVFLADCTGVDDPSVHEATLRRVDRYFGCVATSEEVIAAWAATRERSTAAVT